MLPMAPGCPLIEAETSVRRRFWGSSRASKALDRPTKLHGYRIRAYVLFNIRCISRSNGRHQRV